MISDKEFKDGFGALVAAFPTYGKGRNHTTQTGIVYQRVLAPLMGDRAWRAAVHSILVQSDHFPSIAEVITAASAIVGKARADYLAASAEVRSECVYAPFPLDVARARTWHHAITDENYFDIDQFRLIGLTSWSQAAKRFLSAAVTVKQLGGGQ